ncbi:P-type conjugative transfer protein TrbL [Variovorax sp. RHLX14]|uniref:P-type conjugative transfer protein TrbL n=1 Tax=Variovorax sp. RHLX14 TaxID=1259731 RepID=UPI003F487B40
MSKLRQTVVPVLMFAVLISASAHAGLDSAGVLDNVTARYQAQAVSWSGAITAAATRLFWSLALTSMVWTFGLMALRKADIGELFAELLRYVIFTGFFFFLLSNAPAIATSIMGSLKQLAGDAAGVPGLSPSGIVDVGFKVFSSVIDNSSLWEPVDTAIGAIIAILILGMLALVAINMVVLLVSGWILAYAGIFFLGFGGARWTSEIAINYYKTVLGIAASLMGMTLLVGIGQAVLNEYYLKMGDTTLKDLAVILVVAGMLLYLVNKIPSLIAGIITGASVGGAAGMGGAGAGTLVAAAAMAGAAAAGAVAAVASSATSAAGWGSAVNAAIQQGGEGSDKDTGVAGMPNMSGSGGGGGVADSANASPGTTTPFGTAMGDTGSTGAASFTTPSSFASDDIPTSAQTTQGSGNFHGGSGNASARSNGAITGGVFVPAAENRSTAPSTSGRSALGALGAGIAAVAAGKAGSMMDSVRYQVAQTAGGKVAAEIRSPGSAAAERRNKADIHNSQTVAGKAQAARAFMATGLASSPMPPAFTGDSLSAFNDPETSIDADAEISAFANRTSA